MEALKETIPIFEAKEKSDILICTVRACLASQEGQLNENEDGTENFNDMALAELIAHAKADLDYQKILDADTKSFANYQETIPLSPSTVIGMLWQLNRHYQD